MNIYDIARESGVSISTVSRVMNNHPNVTQNTRERVLSVLEKHNYIPSAIAKSLVVKSTNTIGVMTLDVRHAHYANIAFTIEQELSSCGYNVILCNTGYDRAKLDAYARVLAEKQVDGVIMVGSVFSTLETEESMKRYLPHTPIVMHNSTLRLPNMYNISTEEAHGIVLSVDHLVAKGITEIAYVQDYDTRVGLAKVATYRKELERHGIPYSRKMVVQTVSGLRGGMNAAETLDSRGVSYRAIIGCDDVTAVGIMRHLARRGKRVPEDVAVIGFNNTVFSEMADPPLTVVDNKEEMTGITLSRAIVDLLKGRDIPPQTTLYPELVIRGSA